ncbi:MAG: tyrosine-type recombinase/integrase [Desulfovibrionaceae bacterium]
MAKRVRTKYVGVTEHRAQNPATGKEDVAYYVRYRPAPGSGQVEERVGWKSSGMTPARAANERAARVEGVKQSNQQRRDDEAAAKAAEANRWTVNRLWDEYKRQRSLKGVVQDECRYQKYLAEPYGEKTPDELLTLDVDRLRLRLLKKKSPQTVKHVLALLRRIIRFGVRKGLCPPVDPQKFNIEVPRVDNTVTEDLTAEELQNLLGAIDRHEDQRIANLMRLALYTGMRRGELFRLQWRDVNLERKTVTISDPKGGKSQTIPLSPLAVEVLKETPRFESEYVFPNKKGGKLTDIKRHLNKIRERADLPEGFRPLHGLRHVYASMLASSGQVDMYTLQKLLTHKSAAMTQRYAHLRDDALRHGADVAGDLFTALDQGRKQRTKKVVSWSGAKGEG